MSTNKLVVAMWCLPELPKDNKENILDVLTHWHRPRLGIFVTLEVIRFVIKPSVGVLGGEWEGLPTQTSLAMSQTHRKINTCACMVTRWWQAEGTRREGRGTLSRHDWLGCNIQATNDTRADKNNSTHATRFNTVQYGRASRTRLIHNGAILEYSQTDVPVSFIVQWSMSPTRTPHRNDLRDFPQSVYSFWAQLLLV